MMKVKVFSGSPTVEVPGLGVLTTHVWHTVDKKGMDRFERVNGRTLQKAHVKGRFEVKKVTSTQKKEV